ncbi:MAG TPA: hypothetical protein VKB86_06890 [Pyrinomonadaceae bacterium]|nr:hypothetical protein [Pyrinomonadaceae bacterium]
MRVGIRVNRAEALETIKKYLPPDWKPATRSSVVERLYSIVVGGAGGARPGVRTFNLLYSDAARISRSLNLDEVLERFEDDLKLFVAETTRRRVFVHAGVVGWNGKAIVIPGRSFTGKTTLVAELVRQGATYYSDEYAVLDERGCVHPYLRPLSIRDSVSGKVQRVNADKLGGVHGRKPLPVGLVVVSNYREGARWRPRKLSAGQGALAMFANTVPARRRPEAALSVFREIVPHAQILKGVRGEARETVNYILRELS